MSTPTRRIKQRTDFRAVEFARWFLTVAEEIDAGYQSIKDDLRESGWPSRTPEGDRKPRTNAPEDPPPSYGDPTGELAAQHLSTLQADRDAMQDHRHLMETSAAALVKIAARRRDQGAPSLPCCTVNGCTNPVESVQVNGRPAYIGCQLVAGVWMASPGVEPLCKSCRIERAPRCVDPDCVERDKHGKPTTDPPRPCVVEHDLTPSAVVYRKSGLCAKDRKRRERAA